MRSTEYVLSLNWQGIRDLDWHQSRSRMPSVPRATPESSRIGLQELRKLLTENGGEVISSTCTDTVGCRLDSLLEIIEGVKLGPTAWETARQDAGAEGGCEWRHCISCSRFRSQHACKAAVLGTQMRSNDMCYPVAWQGIQLTCQSRSRMPNLAGIASMSSGVGVKELQNLLT